MDIYIRSVPCGVPDFCLVSLRMSREYDTEVSTVVMAIQRQEAAAAPFVIILTVALVVWNTLTI